MTITRPDPVLTRQERDEIRSWNAELNESVPLTYLRTPDQRSGLFGAFFRDLVELAPAVRGTIQDRSAGFPAFVIAGAWWFHGIPSGTELRPFLRLLALQYGSPLSLSKDLQTLLAAIDSPLQLTLYVSSVCPQCPLLLERLAPFPFLQPDLRINVIDVGLFPEEAQSDGVRAVPTLIWRDDVRWVGRVAVEEVLRVITQPQNSDVPADTIIPLLEGGDADRVARLVLRRRRIFPALMEALLRTEFSLRLGAMVALEDVAESDPDLARGILPALWGHIDDVPVPVKGDIVYLVGKLGDSRWQQPLKDYLASYPNDDDGIKEIGHEALERLSVSSRL